MRDGTGIQHSDVNACPTDPFHSFQIWVHPRVTGVSPREATLTFSTDAKRNAFVLALSPDERAGSARIGQDAVFSLMALDADREARYAMHGAATACELILVGVPMHRDLRAPIPW